MVGLHLELDVRVVHLAAALEVRDAVPVDDHLLHREPPGHAGAMGASEAEQGHSDEAAGVE